MVCANHMCFILTTAAVHILRATNFCAATGTVCFRLRMALPWVSKPRHSGPPLFATRLHLTYWWITSIGEQALVGIELTTLLESFKTTHYVDKKIFLFILILTTCNITLL